MRIDPITERPPVNQDYAFNKSDVDALCGATLLPDDLRREILTRYLRDHGPEELIRLFSQFIGMANSVVASNREMIEIESVVRGMVHPDKSDQLNLPTIFGAMQGALLAVKPTRGMCHGCAFRLGTPANQSACTTTDAQDSLDGEVGPFMCHIHPGPKPNRKCAGATAARKMGRGRVAEMEAACR